MGLYIHIPFCKSKCPYCDFYSSSKKICTYREYTDAVINCINSWCAKIDGNADTLYFGGGTPSLLGGELIAEMVGAAKVFGEFKEITVECNPSSAQGDFFKKIADAGANRISFGLQSAVESERKALGRIAGRQEAEMCIKDAHLAGIDNISVDVMLGIPEQTQKSFDETLDFCISSGAKHISAYMLKIEEGTFFYKNRDKLRLPDDDLTADMYLYMVSKLESAGFMQYEISNFSFAGFESRHNLKYWTGADYLGIGPAAHSFIDGRRFYYERDTREFINGASPVQDGTGGGLDEYIMLRLRLKKGIVFDELTAAFPDADIEKMKAISADLSKNGFVDLTHVGFRLTPKGFLISNNIIEKYL